jgi:dTDP-4-dehydrorhamnose reductase
MEVSHRKAPRYDIYHYANRGICSWYEFAKAITELAGIPCQIEPVPSAAYVTRAKRPRYSVLSTEKIMTDYTIHIPHWKESLRDCMHQLTT